MPMNPRLLVPRASGFNPKSIAGLAFWLDANDSSTVTLVSNAVSQWNDKSGSASPRNFTQTTAANRPATTTVNGKTALLFDGANDRLQNTTADGPAERTWFVVAVKGTLATRQCVVASSKSNITASGTFNSFGFSATNGYPNWSLREDPGGSTSVRAVTTTASTTVPTVFRLRYTQAQIAAANYTNIIRRANGVADNSSTGNQFENYASGVYLGAANQLAGSGNFEYFFNGSLCEILAYDALLSESQSTSVENYLKSKWGVSY
jgi:hypothetical protein